MTLNYGYALAAGAEAVGEWSGLLDRINVFPVADGDTGTNLRASLAPLRAEIADARDLREALLMAARGNSGNIASLFFAGLLEALEEGGLVRGISQGRRMAWSAIPEPRHGTMLSVFDALEQALPVDGLTTPADQVPAVLGELEQAVARTTEQLPELARAGVVDAGALGMFIFLERFLCTLTAYRSGLPSVAQRFGERLELSAGVKLETAQGFCIDAVVRGDADRLAALEGLGRSAVVQERDGLLKIHVHAGELAAVQQALGRAGEVVSFAVDDLGEQTREFTNAANVGPIHLVTDAAGTFHADDAARLGVTLLSSYIQCGEESVPESRMVSSSLYAAMRTGTKVSTSQASLHERHQIFARLLRSHRRVLYITVGSAFSGIHDVAAAWQADQSEPERMVVLDSGAASGRLGVAVRAIAEHAAGATDAEDVIAYARRAVAAADEMVFLDRLKYLAASGRLSRTASFFGEALRLKPVVSPQPDGVQKLGTVRSRRDQLAFAEKRLRGLPQESVHYLVLLQHSDNEEWLHEVVAPRVGELLPGARILVRPLSLTSGAHMGPGTWALAYLGLDAEGAPVGPS